MDGYVTIGTKLDTSGINSGLNIMSREINSKTTAIANGVEKTFRLLKTSIVAVGIGLVLKSITGELNNAISRVDTLNNYTKVMGNLGISSKEAKQSINLLSDKLIGLPTTLDDAAAAVQRFTSANGNIKASTQMFLALNNAILAGGAPTQVQTTAMEQLSQAYAKGKPDMMEWRTAMMAMPAQLKQVAMAMGYVSSDALGEALRKGDISMNEFMATIAKLNKEGVKGFQSFEEQARNSTGGIQTSITNVKTAITRGIAEIMNAIGQSNIASFFQGISSAINKVIPYIVAFIRLMKTAVNSVMSFFGKKTSKQTKETTDAISGLGSSASDTADDLDSTTGSAKKLNKELKNLASFDEMNVLSDNKSSSGGSGSSSSGAGALGDFDLSAFDEAEEKSSKADEIFKNMLKHIKEFGEYLNSLSFDELTKHILNIGNSIKKIFSNPEVQTSLSLFIGNVLVAFKTIGENALKTGINIANGIFGSIDKYLAENIDRISNFFVEMFDIGKVRAILYAQVSEIIEGISEPLTGEVAQQIGANIIAIFVNPLMSVLEILGKFGNDLLNSFIQPISNNMEELKKTIELTLDPINTITATISEALTYIGDSLTTLYDNHFHPLMESLAEDWSDTFGKWLEVYQKNVAPVFKNLANKVTELWNEHLKPLWDEIIAFLTDIIDGLLEFYEKRLKPLIDWIIKNVVPVIVPILEIVGENALRIIGIIADVLKGLIEILRGIIKFIVGVFSGDWKRAWEGIKLIFKGAWDAIKGIFTGVKDIIVNSATKGFENMKNTLSRIMDAVKKKMSDIWNGIWSIIRGVINKIIDGVESMCNSIISGLNLIISPLTKVGNKILSAVGIKGFSFNTISTVRLPRLAKGTIVNAPGKGVLTPSGSAIYGEAGPEAYLPLSDTQLLEQLGSTIGKYITINANITNSMNGRVISRELQKINNESDFAFNR